MRFKPGYPSMLLIVVLLLLTACGPRATEREVARHIAQPAEQPLMLATPSPTATRVEVTPTRTSEPSPSATRTPRPATATATASPTRNQPSPASVAPSAPLTPRSPTVALSSPTITLPTATTPPLSLTSMPVAISHDSQPVRVRIPSIGVDAFIESVGQTDTGLMDVPRGIQNAAWYNLGPTPGKPGNAVLSGHLDDYRQAPAVFWRLNELNPGDLIYIEDASGVERTFTVIGKELYPHDQAPLQRIFGSAFTRNLNLITCNGIWDANAGNYDQRLVVYSQATN